jgi:ankyrin repeat protein
MHEILNDKKKVVWLDDTSFDSALCMAANQGYEHVALLLLDKGANVNVVGKYRSSALQGALSNGHEQIVWLLLERDADINAVRRFGSSTLQGASSNGHEQIV